jgi:hypothetical protein
LLAKRSNLLRDIAPMHAGDCFASLAMTRGALTR